MFSLGAVFGKKLSTSQTAGQTMAAKYLFQLILCMIIIWVLKKPVTIAKNEVRYVAIRTIGIGCANTLIYWTFNYLPYDSACVIFNGIIAVCCYIISRIWLKELIQIYDAVVMVVIMIGTFLSAQPQVFFNISSTDCYRHGFIIGLTGIIIAGIMYAFSSCVNRKIVETDALIIITLLSVMGVCIGSLYMLATWRFWDSSISRENVLLNIVLGLFSIGGSYCWTRGLQVSNTVEFIIGAQMDIPFGLIFQQAILDIAPNAFLLAGGVLVIIGVTLWSVKTQVLVFMGARLERQGFKPLENIGELSN